MTYLETLNYDDLDSVSKLQKSQRYVEIIQKVEESPRKDGVEKGTELEDDDPEYKLIVDCNQLLSDIENEIVIVYNYIREKYKFRFQELESLVHNPIDYARVVKKIGDNTDLALVDLEGLLESKLIIAVSLSAVTTKGNPLPQDTLQKTLDACDRVLDLDSTRKQILDFLESKMESIAPNLSAIVGSIVAAKLMGTAGGLSELSKMPACNLQVLGHKRKNLAGFSTATSQSRVGYLEETEIFQISKLKLEPLLPQIVRLLAAKSTLAARVDATKGDTSGTKGKAFREEIRKKIEKWQELFPASQPKPLPVPDLNPKKRRGGRRQRKTKERYAMTEMRKLGNRIAFGVPEESSLGDGLGEGYGMLGSGSKRMRVTSVPSKVKVNAKIAKKLKERQYVSGVSTSGLTSSLGFSNVQGIELCNPQAFGLGSGTQSTYFSELGTFSKLKKI